MNQADLSDKLNKPISKWVIVVTILLAVIGIEAFLIVVQNKEIYTLRSENTKYKGTRYISSQPSVQSTAAPSNRSISSKLLTSTLALSNSTRNGWVTYQNEDMGVRFEFPVNSVELIESKDEITGKTRDIEVRSKKTLDFEGQQIQLLSFTDTNRPYTYGEVDIPESTDSGRFTIQGKKYDASNFIMGEGHGCGGGTIKTAVAKLSDTLFVNQFFVEIERNILIDI